MGNRSGRCVVGPLPVCPPVPLVCTRIGIEDNDSPVSVPVGNEHFIRLRVDGHVGGLTEIRDVVAAGPAPAMSDLQQELARAVELEDLVFTRPARATPGNPDVVTVVDVDPVLVVGEWPVVPLTRTAQLWSSRPDGSNCITTGAALQHAFFSVTLAPLWTIHTLSLESVAMPAMAPKSNPPARAAMPDRRDRQERALNVHRRQATAIALALHRAPRPSRSKVFATWSGF